MWSILVLDDEDLNGPGPAIESRDLSGICGTYGTALLHGDCIGQVLIYAKLQFEH